MQNLDIYISRCLSAFGLFLLLSCANIWLNPIENTVLVLGYRLFILLTPFLFLFFRQKITFVAFFVLEIGLFLWLFDYTMLGVIMFAVGISISGYMLKYYSSSTAAGSAHNKIALNLGSFLSGLFIIFSQNKTMLLTICFVVIFVSAVLFFKYYNREKIKNLVPHHLHFSFVTIFTKNGLIWGLVGLIIGIKLIAMVAILPQLLMKKNNGILPNWFGIMLMINSLFVVFFQKNIMKKVQHLGVKKAMIPSLCGMILIAVAGFISIENFIIASIWIVLLSIIECTMSYLDKLSQDDNSLLIKEAMVGIGSALTVYLIRFFDPQTGSLITGMIGVVICIVVFMLKNNIDYYKLK